MSDTLAAIGSASGPMVADIATRCKTGSPISVIAFHGTSDSVVPITGGHFTAAGGGNLISATDTIKNWTIRDNCSTAVAPKIYKIGKAITVSLYLSCDAKTNVKFYSISGMNHRHPTKIGAHAQDINAIDEMWSFFKNNPKI